MGDDVRRCEGYAKVRSDHLPFHEVCDQIFNFSNYPPSPMILPIADVWVQQPRSGLPGAPHVPGFAPSSRCHLAADVGQLFGEVEINCTSSFSPLKLVDLGPISGDNLGWSAEGCVCDSPDSNFDAEFCPDRGGKSLDQG